MQTEDWETTGLNGLDEGCLGPGSEGGPIIIFGDASGGVDSSSNKMRRAGVAIVCVTAILPQAEIRATVSGPLAGDRQ
eukprot:4086289-Pyramimonas_sp.AAC.1